ncbi:hypothetical protein QWY86_04835 [Pedobacter aquatilis]|uniref:hypothetical protein n=1 Tax=Pedobacter aquatilis TaxID=351343 RepID=UPI0025B2C9E4|nr:hypothetical protein [Pedobacter aquatilis]MDN3585980.1 hypothetical protein [Pedobacter aquatilis]
MNIKEKIKSGQLDELLDEQGIPEYVLQTDDDLQTVAIAIKAYLEQQALIAHNFSSKVWDKERSQSIPFDYCSNWPLDGLAEGEIE